MGWILPRPLQPMWNRGPQWKGCCSLEVFSWTICFITNEKGAESSKIRNVFIHAHLLTRDDDRWYFPRLCGVSETTVGHSRQASLTTFPHVSLFTKGDDSAKTVPVQSCFWRTCFGPFRSIATSSFNGIYPWSKHCIGSWFGQILFLSVVFIVFLSQ